MLTPNKRIKAAEQLGNGKKQGWGLEKWKGWSKVTRHTTVCSQTQLVLRAKILPIILYIGIYFKHESKRSLKERSPNNIGYAEV